ncbi:MAG TPA: histidine--tRNA ligase [Lacibacter sp.]|nr:histidine--tRNA ligase [Lacibacter sp.]
MAKVNVTLPQGTRDFDAATVRKRSYIMNTIRDVFELYGFEPLETPAMEQLSTLMGKYGEEGDKLIFKILNNGLERPEKHEQTRTAFEEVLQGKNTALITERALKYDLTIPFARYVAMNHQQLTLPFRRYQMQPVWRADRPQKGRYREFYQCDADIVGSRSLYNEAELAAIYATVFERLGIPADIRVNSRKILAALAESCGGANQLTAITTAIDKLDKIGGGKEKEELEQRGLNAGQIAAIERYLLIEGSNEEKLRALQGLLGEEPAAVEGAREITWLLHHFPAGSRCTLTVDFTLARGLNYYTGIIFEVKAPGIQMGSIGGGGRYDDLTGLFGVPGIPGIGISFGVDRIYDVLEAQQLFPATVQGGPRVLFFNLGAEESQTAFRLLQQLRSKGIAGELYHEPQKMDKQFRYAEKKGIPYAIIIGSRELEQEQYVVRHLPTGQQQLLGAAEILSFGFF